MKKKNKERFIGLGYALFGDFEYLAGVTKWLIIIPFGLILVFYNIQVLFT